MHRLLWVLIISGILMFGCSPDKEPDEGIKEAQEDTRAKSVAELQVYSGDLENGIAAILDKFCWEREEQDTCDLSPSDPKVTTEEQLGSPPLIVKAGDPVLLYYDNLTNQIPLPDEYVVIQYSSHDDIGVDVDVSGDQYNPEIQLPDKPGKYYYTVHIQWHEETVGEAYYAFFLRVKKDS